jgi:hypothetical protein
MEPKPNFELMPAELWVKLEYRGFPRTHFFKKPTAEDCRLYLEGLHTTRSTDDLKTFESQFDGTDADLRLWESLIDRVEGYKSAKLDGADIMTSDKWRDLVPLPHKQAAAQALFVQGVEIRPAEASEMIDDEIEISLQAMQNGQVFMGLIHRFRFPTPFELKEWNRSNARTRVEFKGKTMITHETSRFDLETKLYDWMIQSVFGYCAGRASVIEGDNLGALMHPIHKTYAIKAAFASFLEESAGPLALNGSAPGSGNSSGNTGNQEAPADAPAA